MKSGILMMAGNFYEEGIIMNVLLLLSMLVSFLPTPFVVSDLDVKNPGCNPTIHVCTVR
jgi:uncharacterized membrane protein